MSELSDAVKVRDAKANVLTRFPWSIVAENDYLMAQANVDLLFAQQNGSQTATEVNVVIHTSGKSSRQNLQPRRASGKLRGGF